MTLRVAQVPPPAAGQDWSYTIPGNYVEDVVGVAATLTTKLAVTTIPDETGNGHTATVIAGNKSTLGAPGPYAGGANNFALFGNGDVTSHNAFAEAVAANVFNVANGTLECLVNVSTHNPALTDGNGWGALDNGATVVRVGYGSDRNSSADPVPLALVSNGSFRTITSPGSLSRNAWHSIALTWDGTTFRLYIDGVAAGTHTGDMPIWSQGQPFIGSQEINNPVYGSQAACAFYGTTLTAGQIAAHFAALSSWTAYRTAVLADSPIAFWGLNTNPGGPSRTVALDITDGTHVVEEIPSGFASAGNVGTYAYSWQSQLGGNTQTPTQSTTTVAIPDLILPPGYTIGTRTLDIGATDQWSNISVWWNDTFQTGVGFQDRYEYPPGVHLVYRQAAGVP